LRIFWSVRSRKELRAIHTYIARDSEYYASRMANRLIARIEAAALAPACGHPVHEYPEAPLREVHEYPYRIIYLASVDKFYVVTIVHFKQQLDS
jgi:plasmid stabilization system protein ParE